MRRLNRRKIVIRDILRARKVVTHFRTDLYLIILRAVAKSRDIVKIKHKSSETWSRARAEAGAEKVIEPEKGREERLRRPLAEGLNLI